MGGQWRERKYHKLCCHGIICCECVVWVNNATGQQWYFRPLCFMEWNGTLGKHRMICKSSLQCPNSTNCISPDSLVPRPYARARERVWLHKSKSLGSLQNLKASNEIAKWRLLEYCGSKRIYVLPCESNSFTILWLSMCCVLSGPFATAGSPSYIYILYYLCQSILTIKFLEDKRSEGRLVSNQLL